MTRRLQHRWLSLGAATIAVLLCAVPAFAQAGPEITVFVENDGRVVFTNMARVPPLVSSPPRTTIGAVPQPASTTRSTTGATRTTPYDELIESISARHGVDSKLVRAVIEVESNFQRDAVSPKGARGLMQLIPETGARFGVQDPFDPAQNIEGGVRYLSFLLNMFEGSMDLSLAAYNSGENRVARLGRIPRIRETQDYVQKVRTAYQRMGGTGDRLLMAAVETRFAEASPVNVWSRTR